MEKFGKKFFRREIWSRVIGENFYLTTILDFFQKNDFTNTFFEEQKIEKDDILSYVDDQFWKGVETELTSLIKRSEKV